MSLNAFVLDVPTIDFHRLKAKFRFNRTFHLHTTPRTDALNGSSDSGYWKSSHTHTDVMQLRCISSANRNSFKSWNLWQGNHVTELWKVAVTTHCIYSGMRSKHINWFVSCKLLAMVARCSGIFLHKLRWKICCAEKITKQLVLFYSTRCSKRNGTFLLC